MAGQIRQFSFIKLKYNIWFLLSGCAVILMNIYDFKSAAIGIGLAVFLLLASCFFQNIHAYFRQNISLSVMLPAAVLAFISAAVAYNMQIYMGNMIIGNTGLIIVVFGEGIASVYFLTVMLCVIKGQLRSENTDGRHEPCLSSMDRIALVGIVIVILAAGFWYLTQKCSFFWDELYTFGLSNSYYQPFLLNPDDGNGIVSGAERYQEYLMVTTDRFCYGSVLYNQISDVHPPLYYLLIHTICSIAPGLSMMAVGYLVNAFFAVLLVIGLFVWCYRNFDRVAAYAVVLCYGLSTSFFSMFMLFRMYMALTYFTFLLIAVLYELYTGRSNRGGGWLAASLFLGGLTHYYFLIYAVFACLFFAVLLAVEKRWTQLWKSFSIAMVTACIYYSVWGNALIWHMLSSGNGESVASRLFERHNNVVRFWAYFQELLTQISSSPFVSSGMFIFLLLTVLSILTVSVWKKTFAWMKGYLLITLPALFSFAVVAKGSSSTYARYIYNLVPFFWLALWIGISYLIKKMRVRTGISAAVTLLTAYFAFFCAVPSYLYLQYQDIVNYLYAHGEETICVYYKSSPWYTEIVCLDFLMGYQTTYVVDESSLEWLTGQEFGNCNHILLLNEDVSRIEEIVQDVGFTAYEEIGVYAPMENSAYRIVVYELSR